MKMKPKVFEKGRCDADNHIHELPGGGYTGPAQDAGSGQHWHDSRQGRTKLALNHSQHTHWLADGTKTMPAVDYVTENRVDTQGAGK